MARRRHGRLPVKFLIGFVIVAAVLIICINFVFVVHQVAVNGAPDFDKNEIVRISGIKMGDPLLFVSRERIRMRIEADGRLIYEGTDTRLPSTLVLNLRQRQKAALTMQGSHTLYLDTDGHVLEAADNPAVTDLPLINGLSLTRYGIGETVDTQPERLDVLCELLRLFQEKNILHSVSAADLTDTDSMMLTLRNGLNIKLGNGENLSTKLDILISTVNDMYVRGEGTGTLDVSSGTKADYAP